MNVSLTKELEKLVNDKVESGLYHTASEVIRDGLRLLDERDHLYRARLLALREDVRKGLDQLDRGKGRPFRGTALKKRLHRDVGGSKGRRGAK